MSALLSSPPHRSTRSSDLITLNRTSVTSCLNLSNRYFYQSAPVLWNSLPSHLRHAAQHSTSSPTSDSCIPNLGLSKKIEISPFLHFLSSLISGSPLFTGSATPRVRHSQGSDSVRICEVWMSWWWWCLIIYVQMMRTRTKKHSFTLSHTISIFSVFQLSLFHLEQKLKLFDSIMS